MGINYDANFIRNRITQLRTQRNISEREMSFALGKAHSYIHNIVSGQALPHMENFLEICEFFDITPLEFFNVEMSNPTLSKKVSTEIEKLPFSELERINIFFENVSEEHRKSLIKAFLDVLDSYSKNT